MMGIRSTAATTYIHGTVASEKRRLGLAEAAEEA
jgi:hypothetical protein